MQKSLIIDDNRATADGLKLILSLLSIEAEVAYGSRAGMGMLKEQTPQMVFLDINMPGLSGFEVLAYLQREPRLESVPVIVVTSDDQAETKQKALDSGAKAVVIKPVTVELLEESLKEANLLANSG